MLNKSLPYIDFYMKRLPLATNYPIVFKNDNFKLVNFVKGDETEWAKIETSVAEFENETAALDYFNEKYLPNIALLKERCFFIETDAGVKIATGTAWYNEYDNQIFPVVDWISVMPNYQGLGLGKIIVQAVLNKLSACYPQQIMYLHTQTWSHFAVALYQKLGFELVTDAMVFGKPYPQTAIAQEIVQIANKQHASPKQRYRFDPCTLSGSVEIPPSKSYAHRYIIAAALADTPTTLLNMQVIADDIQVTLDAIKYFGATYAYQNQALIIRPQTDTVEAGTLHKVNMRESGTSLRLLMPLLIQELGEVEILGENKLPKRSLKPYFDIFTDVDFITPPGNSNLPLLCSGTLEATIYQLPGNISSQFISGLLFALPRLQHDSEIRLTSPLVSLPYVQMTLKVLADFGIEITHHDNYSHFIISGNQSYQSTQSYFIENDFSARAFWEVARAIGHQDLVVTPPYSESLQGDSIIIDLISQQQTVIDLTHIPDLAPILAIYLACTTGGTLLNTNRLIDKESNRLLAIEHLLSQAGIKYEQKPNQIMIASGKIKSNTYFTFYDHRITMALIIAASVADGSITINEVGSINKSYPSFIADYQKLGGNIHEQ